MFGLINLVDKAFWPPLRHSSAGVCSLYESSSSPSQIRVTSQVRVRFRFFCFLFPFASFLYLSKAVIVILAFIMMCQLMFEALMRRSNRNLNIPPPPGKPRAFDYFLWGI